MDGSTLTLVIGLALGLAVGFALGWLLSRRSRTGSEDAIALRAQLDLLQTHYQELQAKQESENKILQTLIPVSEKLADMQKVVSDMERQRHEQHG